MKKTLLALIVLAVGLGLAFQPQLVAEQPTPAYHIELDVQPVEGVTETYSCRVTVSQGDDVLAAPRLQFEVGSEAQARSSNPKTGEVVDFTVFSDSETGAVSYTVAIQGADGDLVTRHQARILL